MQRVLPLLFTLFALYACTGTVPHKPEDEKPPSATAGGEQPTDELIGTELFGVTPPADLFEEELEPEPHVLPIGEPYPHIALLLPLKSPNFGAAADAVQQGFLAAASYKRLMLPIRVYSDFDEDDSVVGAYRQAIANGARAVVGPLTRSGVSALAAEKYVPVPTLALNISDGEHARRFYFFGMAIEEEARQVARLAIQQGLHQAIIVTVRSALSQRLQAAFEEEWSGAGRGILREIEFDNDIGLFADIGNTTDTMVFIAADADKARRIRPYLPSKVPVYASSQIFAGNEKTLTNYDLNGIRFVDMPWLLQPEHPAVMIYARANPPLPIASERLYALGIDSFRLVQMMLDGDVAALPLDGVSGRIKLNGHVFQREALAARFIEGQARPFEAVGAPTVQMFPERTVNQP